MRRVGKLFGCSCMLKSCFNIYVLSSLEYCAPMWMSSVKSHLDLMDSIDRSAERLREGELYCLGHRRKVCACVCSIRFITEWTTL